MGSSHTGGSVFGNIANLGSFLLKLRGVVSITLIIVLLTNLSALSAAWHERSMKPLIEKVGGQLLNHDNALYIDAVELEEQGGVVVDADSGNKLLYIWGALTTLGRASLDLWYLWVFGLVFFKFYSVFTQNESNKLVVFVLTIMSLVLLQVLANVMILDSEIDANPIFKELPKEERYFPFKGLVKFAKASGNLLNPIYQQQTGDPLFGEAESAENKTQEPQPLVNSINMLTGA